MCALTLSRLDDFSDSYLFTVMITIFLGGKLGISGGGGSFYPSNTPDRDTENKGSCN